MRIVAEATRRRRELEASIRRRDRRRIIVECAIHRQDEIFDTDSSESMNDDEKGHSLDTPESVADNNATPPGNYSFYVEETEADKQEESARQIEVETGAPPAIRKPAHLTLVGGNDDDPPYWPDF